MAAAIRADDPVTTAMDPRAEHILDQVLRFARLEFDARAPVGPNGDTLDAIAVGLNMLGEELADSVVSSDQLVQTERRLALVLENSPAVIYTRAAQPPHGVAYITPNVTRVLGHPPDHFIQNPEFWNQQVHGEDVARSEPPLPALGPTICTLPSTDFEGKMVPIDGSATK